MTTKSTDQQQPPRKAPVEPVKGADEPEPTKLPGVPGHLQAAVQQLMGDDAPTSKPQRPTDR